MNSQDRDRPTNSLEDLRIASPCHEPWSAMSGDDRERFCDRCELQVHNLSGMTRDDATRVVAEAEGRLCVRFHRRADGSVLTQDCPVGLAARTGRLLKACAAGLLALIGFLPGCTITGSVDLNGDPGAECGEPIQGDVCFEEEGEADVEEPRAAPSRAEEPARD